MTVIVCSNDEEEYSRYVDRLWDEEELAPKQSVTTSDKGMTIIVCEASNIKERDKKSTHGRNVSKKRQKIDISS